MLRKSWLILFFLLGACAALPPGPPPDKALVHIYRRALPPGPTGISLFDGVQPIGHLTAGSYFNYIAAPGPRVFKAAAPGTGSIPYATSLVVGQTYYFMVYILGDQQHGNATITQVDAATATKQMANLKPAGP